MAGTAIAAAPVVHRSRGVVRINVALATDDTADGGDIAETVIGSAFGTLRAVLYDGGCDASAVITLKDHKTGSTLFTLTTGTEGTPVYLLPTGVVVTDAGATITIAGDVATDVNRPIKVGGKLSLTVANMGVSESGVIAFVIDEAGIGDIALTV